MPNLFTSANTKTMRGEERGFRTFVLHLAASDASGKWDVCKFASIGCRSACLIHAGRLPMSADLQTWRTRLLFTDPDEFYTRLYEEIVNGARASERAGLTPVFRLNGTSDLPWERMGLQDGVSIFEAFPEHQFYDYTKFPLSGRRDALKHGNYHLTFSWSEGPRTLPEGQRRAWVAQAAQEWLDVGVNVTAVFGRYVREENILPPRHDLGFGDLRVIDGDADDLRFLDPKGVIVGLKAKFKSYDILERGIESGFILPGSYKGRPSRVRKNPPSTQRSVNEVDEAFWLYGIGCSGGQELDNIPLGLARV